ILQPYTSIFFLRMHRSPLTPPLFPYTTLFRSRRVEYPDAEFLVHPECGCVTSAMYYAEAEGDVAASRMRIVSTEQMMQRAGHAADRKSTRLNSSHVAISYAVFCLKKKKKRSGP